MQFEQYYQGDHIALSGFGLFEWAGRTKHGRDHHNNGCGKDAHTAVFVWKTPERKEYKKPMAIAIRILGLDPGLSRMGWGVIDVAGTRLSHVAHGVIVSRSSDGLGYRLRVLHVALSEVIAEYHPTAIAIEQAFVAKDPQAALKIGHARAVALLAAAQAELEIAEYAPNHIKKCVVGAGHAGKEQVQAMVKRLLPSAYVAQADAADALAAAIAHAHLAGTRARIAAALI